MSKRIIFGIFLVISITLEYFREQFWIMPGRKLCVCISMFTRLNTHLTNYLHFVDVIRVSEYRVVCVLCLLKKHISAC